MRIGIDGRCLIEPNPSGVGYYTFNLLKEWQKNSEHQFFLFTNSWKNLKLPHCRTAQNFFEVKSRYPNKFFNLLQLLGLSMIDMATVQHSVDMFWLPNLNFFSSQKKKIITIHDLSFEVYPEFFSPKMRVWHKATQPAKLLSQADQIIAVSNNTKKDIVNIYQLPEEKIKVVYSGVGEEFFQKENKDQLDKIRSKYQLPERFILFLGTVEPRKNIAGLLEAFALMKKRFGPQLSSCHLVIAGGWGWLYRKILKIYQHSAASQSIKFIGYVDETDRPGLYQLASLFVFPSFYEGFGFPPLEAAASQVPVLASYSGSLGEILENTAVLIDPYNINQLAAAMAHLLLDPPDSATLSQISQKIRQKYCWSRAAAQTLSIITQAK